MLGYDGGASRSWFVSLLSGSMFFMKGNFNVSETKVQYYTSNLQAARPQPPHRSCAFWICSKPLLQV